MMILTKRFCDPPNLSPIGFCGAKSGYLWCKSMVFVVRKYGFCSVKVWFLWCKSMVFRGCTCVYCNLFAALLQTVSSCRGPIYRACIYVNAHEMEGGNACAVKWMCVFNNVNMFICLCKDTGTMNRPLRLAECSQPISWVSVGISRNVCWYFAECFVCIP